VVLVAPPLALCVFSSPNYSVRDSKIVLVFLHVSQGSLAIIGNLDETRSRFTESTGKQDSAEHYVIFRKQTFPSPSNHLRGFHILRLSSGWSRCLVSGGLMAKSFPGKFFWRVTVRLRFLQTLLYNFDLVGNCKSLLFNPPKKVCLTCRVLRIQ
jgi:hypothetical protein